jgi:hypothetical protein
MLLVVPPIFSLPPLRFGPDDADPRTVLMASLIASPFWIGAAAAPGYLYAWSGVYEPSLASRGTRAWVTVSLIAGLVASVGGLISIAVLIPFPFSVASILSSAFMLRRFVTASGGPPANSRLQRTALRAAAEPPSR